MAAHAVAKPVLDAAETRHAPRRPLRLELGSDEGAGGTVLRNISRTGALIASATPLKVGEQLDIAFPEIGTRTLTVRWTEGSLYGCRFDAPIPPAAISAALLRSEPLQSSEPDLSSLLSGDEEVFSTYPLPTRMRILLGLSLLSWGLVWAAMAAVG